MEDRATEGIVPPQEAKQQQKEERLRLLQERKPLLQACDHLRQDLAIYGINIKVSLSFPTAQTLLAGQF